MPPLARVERCVDPFPRREHLFDRSVTDRVDTHLEAGAVRAVEEGGEVVVRVVRDAAVLGSDERLRDRRRPRADRPVGREVTPDRVVAELDRPRHVHRRDDRDRVDGQSLPVPPEDLDVAFTVVVRHRHLVHRRHAARRGEARRRQLQPLDLVVRPQGSGPAPELRVGPARDDPRRSPTLVALAPLGLGDLRRPERGGVGDRDVTVDPADHERSFHGRVELGERRDLGRVPGGLVEPLEGDDLVVRRLGAAGGERQQSVLRPHQGDVLVRLRRSRAGEVDVAVDEPRHHRGPRQLHHTIGRGGFPAPDPLDVAPVDEDPLPRRRMGEGVHARGAVERLHGGAMMPRRSRRM
jgi:hypothetical protein